MRVTRGGRVTIPAEIRARFGFLPGTEVEFVAHGDVVLLRRASEPGGHGASASSPGCEAASTATSDRRDPHADPTAIVTPVIGTAGSVAALVLDAVAERLERHSD